VSGGSAAAPGRCRAHLQHRGAKQSIQPGDRAALKRWLLVLRDTGTITPPALQPITPQDQILEEFGDYLRRERGLARLKCESMRLRPS